MYQEEQQFVTPKEKSTLFTRTLRVIIIVGVLTEDISEWLTQRL